VVACRQLRQFDDLLAIEKSAERGSSQFGAQFVPHARRDLCVAGFQLITLRAHVRKEDDVVFECIGAKDVLVVFVLHAEDQTAGLLLFAGEGLKRARRA
jgi:hypothetical protein